MFKHAKKGHKKRGDTLVEVALAIAILGAVVISTVTIMTSTLGTSEYTLQETMARNEIDVQAEALRYIHNAYTAQMSEVAADQEYKGVWEKIISYAVVPAKIAELNSVASCDDYYTKDTAQGLYTDTGKGFIINTRKLSTSYTKGASAAMLDTIVVNSKPLTGVASHSKFQLASVYPRVLYGGMTGEESLGDQAEDAASNTNINVSRAEGIWVSVACSETKASDPSKCADNPEYYDFYIRTCWETTDVRGSTTHSSIVRLRNPDYERVRLAGGGVTPPVGTTVNYKVNYYKGSTYVGADGPFMSGASSYSFVLKTGAAAGDSNIVGWCKTPTAGGTCSNPASNTAAGSSLRVYSDEPEIYLKAVYRKSYELYYHANGDAVSGMPRNVVPGTCYTTSSSSTGCTITISSTRPSRINYSFVKWKDGSGRDRNPGATVTITAGSTYNLYAQWTHGAVLAFDANAGGDTVTNMPSNLTCSSSTGSCNVTIPATMPVRSGYTFKGWATRASGSVAYAAGRTHTKSISGNVTIYAVWERVAARYQLAFNDNGASATNMPSTQTCTPSGDTCNVTIPATIPSRSGDYFFLGWATTASGPVFCKRGSTCSIELNTHAGTSQTVYAVWHSSRMQDMDATLCHSAVFDGGAIQLMKDDRTATYNSIIRRYYVGRASDGTCWMRQNLRWVTATSSDGNHTESTDSQGCFYYSSDLNSICPSGWKVPNDAQMSANNSRVSFWGFRNVDTSTYENSGKAGYYWSLESVDADGNISASYRRWRASGVSVDDVTWPSDITKTKMSVRCAWGY